VGQPNVMDANEASPRRGLFGFATTILERSRKPLAGHGTVNANVEAHKKLWCFLGMYRMSNLRIPDNVCRIPEPHSGSRI